MFDPLPQHPPPNRLRHSHVERLIALAYLENIKKFTRFASIQCRNLGNVVEAEDVIQEAFTRVGTRLLAGTLQYRDPASFRGLLSKTIKQQASAMSRKARLRQAGRDWDTDLQALCGPVPDPDFISEFLAMFTEHKHQLQAKLRKAVELAIRANFNLKSLTRYRRGQLALAFKQLKQLWNSPN